MSRHNAWALAHIRLMRIEMRFQAVKEGHQKHFWRSSSISHQWSRADVTGFTAMMELDDDLKNFDEMVHPNRSRK